jgi:hypothetical protein
MKVALARYVYNDRPIDALIAQALRFASGIPRPREPCRSLLVSPFGSRFRPATISFRHAGARHLWPEAGEPKGEG